MIHDKFISLAHVAPGPVLPSVYSAELCLKTPFTGFLLCSSSLIGFVDSQDQPQWHGYVYVAAMIGVSMLKAIVGQQHFYGKQLTGLQVRSSLTAASYRKVSTLCSLAGYVLFEDRGLFCVDRGSCVCGQGIFTCI